MKFIENIHSDVVYMTAPNISTVHAFTSRFGGVSRGDYASLNLWLFCGDNPDYVRKNYNIICQTLSISDDDLVRSSQVHGSHVRTVTREDCCKIYSGEVVEADGLITTDNGVTLIIFIADCVPILLHDSVCNAIGAVHSGWRGTAKNIAGVAVQRMINEFGCSPKNIKAAIGPCISKCCYETGVEVAEALSFIKDYQSEEVGYSSRDSFIEQYEEKYMIDLKEANHLLLRKAGLTDIAISDECTLCNSEKYWSHRKTNGKRGSQAAIISNQLL